MMIETKTDQSVLIITPPARFDLGAYKDFTKSYEPALLSRSFRLIHIDMSQIGELDSGLLGILADMKEKVFVLNIEIVFTGCSKEITNLLDISGLRDPYMFKYFECVDGKPQACTV